MDGRYQLVAAALSSNADRSLQQARQLGVARGYGDGETLLRETDVGAVDTWTYDSAMQAEDGDPTSVWIELESMRDGIASFTHYRFNIVLKGGWGYGWGLNWGGAG